MSSETPSPNTIRHERLQAWSACHELTLAVYRATLAWSAPDHLPVGDAARAAAREAGLAVMLGANGPRAEFRAQLDGAVTHLTRLGAVLQAAVAQGALAPAGHTALEIQRDHALRLTQGLLRSLGRKRGRRAAA